MNIDQSFIPLKRTYKGAEQHYELRDKFALCDPDCKSDHGGIIGWAEPVLVLYVSVSKIGAEIPATTLLYALSRSCFSNGLSPLSADEVALLKRAEPQITSDLKQIAAG